MLIRAVVHARLLGLRLLTLDARVVVADLDPTAIDLVETVDIDPALTPRDPMELSGRRRDATVGPSARARKASVTELDGGVTRARELLAEGTDILARTRR